MYKTSDDVRALKKREQADLLCVIFPSRDSGHFALEWVDEGSKADWEAAEDHDDGA